MTAIETLKSIQRAINNLLGPQALVLDGDFGPKSTAALEEVKKRAAGERDSAPAAGKFDERTEKTLATLDLKAQAIFRPFISAAKQIAAASGLDYIAISGTRTWAEQDALYAQGRSKPGKIVTNARGGESWHNFGIALDFGVFRNGKYLDESEPKTASAVHKAIGGGLAQKHGLDWGGNWTSIVDEPHFQVATGLSMAQARAKFKEMGSVIE